MRLGRDVKEDWLCLNAAAYLWNYHLPLFKQGHLDDVYEALEETVATLLLCKARDAVLFASLADGLARALEQRHASGQEAAYPPQDLTDAPPLGCLSPRASILQSCNMLLPAKSLGVFGLGVQAA